MLDFSDMTDEELDELRRDLEHDLAMMAQDGRAEAADLSAELDDVEAEILCRFGRATGQL